MTVEEMRAELIEICTDSKGLIPCRGEACPVSKACWNNSMFPPNAMSDEEIKQVYREFKGCDN